MADTLRKDVITGARIRLEVNGRKVGHMTDVNVSFQFQLQDLEECGTPIAAAILIVGLKAFLTAGYAKIRTTDPFRDLFLPSMAASAIIDWPEMTGTIFDNQTDEPLIQVVSITPEAYDFRGGARTIVAQNLRWRARTGRHPSEG